MMDQKNNMKNRFNIIDNEKDMNKNKKKKSSESKRISIKRFAVFFLILILLIFVALYISNSKFRKSVDIYIFRKEIDETKLKSIQISNDKSNYTFVGNDGIYVLSRGELSYYDKAAVKRETKVVEIGSAVGSFNKHFGAICEKNGRKLLIVEKGKIKHQKELEMNIRDVCVGKGDYVVIIGSNSLYKSIIVVLNSKGQEIVKKHYATTYVSKVDISSNDKMIAIGSVDYYGILVNSKIEIYDISLLSKGEQNAKIAEMKKDKMLIDISFKNRETILVRFNDSIFSLSKKGEANIYDIGKNIEYVDIRNKDGFVTIEKRKSNIFITGYDLKSYSVTGNQIGIFVIGEDKVDSLHSSSESIIVVCEEKLFALHSNSWLKKKYKSKKGFIDYRFSDTIVAVIYKDRIDILEI